MFANNDVTIQWLPLSETFVHKANRGGTVIELQRSSEVVEIHRRVFRDAVFTSSLGPGCNIKFCYLVVALYAAGQSQRSSFVTVEFDCKWA